MFRNDYKDKIDSIRADGYIKQKVLKTINEKNDKKPLKTVKYKVIRTAATLAACFALVLSLWAIDIGKITDSGITVSTASYSDIYKSLNKFLPEEPSFLDKVIDFSYNITNGTLKSSNYAVEEEYEFYSDSDGAAMPESATGATTDSTASATTADTEDISHSETTTQVEGVAESDIVKTDGRFIYSLSPNNGTLRIIKAGKSPVQMSSTVLNASNFRLLNEMYLVGEKIVVIGTDTKNSQTYTKAYIYDVSDPAKPEKLYECRQSGDYNNSRLIGDKLYLITHYSIFVENIREDSPDTYIPYVECKDYDSPVTADSISVYDNCEYPEYTVICGFSLADGGLCGTQSLLGGTENLYCSTKNIITAGYSFSDGSTAIVRYAVNDGKIELKAKGTIDGSLLNQFSIDEYNGYFRFVTTTSKGIESRDGNIVSYRINNANALFVLDENLKQVGAIENIAPNERVYSVRFMGDIAYFVTFRNVDPLFSADLSDPENPKIIGALKIPGFSNYLFPYGEGKLLGLGQDADESTGRTGGIKLSMFDISDPSNVRESAKMILDVSNSEALNDHKAALIDLNKNLIAFPVWAENGNEYRVFSFQNGEFVNKAAVSFDGVYENVRGLYINSEFYIINDSMLSVFDINTFQKLSEITLK